MQRHDVTAAAAFTASLIVATANAGTVNVGLDGLRFDFSPSLSAMDDPALFAGKRVDLGSATGLLRMHASEGTTLASLIVDEAAQRAGASLTGFDGAFRLEAGRVIEGSLMIGLMADGEASTIEATVRAGETASFSAADNVFRLDQVSIDAQLSDGAFGFDTEQRASAFLGMLSGMIFTPLGDGQGEARFEADIWETRGRIVPLPHAGGAALLGLGLLPLSRRRR